MKKSIIISIIALLISVVSFAQNTAHKSKEHKAPSVEQIAKFNADHKRKVLNLNDTQYQKLYKLYLKQAKKQKAQMAKMKKEHEKMNAQLKKIFTAEQWVKYEKIQKRKMQNWRKDAQRPTKPGMRPANGSSARPIKGPTIEKPESRRNNMYLEK